MFAKAIGKPTAKMTLLEARKMISEMLFEVRLRALAWAVV